MESNRKTDRINTGAIVAVLLLLWGCAHIEAPPGGPEDKTPPYLMAVFPQPGSVNQPLELNVQLEFSEWMSSTWKDLSYVSQITLSPILPRKLKFETKGKKIRVYSHSELEPGTTYILSVNNGLTDIQGQPLGNPFQLVFSTGPKIDSAGLAGTLMDGASGKTKSWVGLYPIGEIRKNLKYLPGHGTDSLKYFPDITSERPMYLAAADSAGAFSMTAVGEGRYALLGFSDANGDLKPNPGQEPIAIGDTLLIKDKAEANLRLKDSKWEALKLLSANWLPSPIGSDSISLKGIVELKFNSEVLWSQALHPHAFKIEAVDSGPPPQMEPPFIPKKKASDVFKLGLSNLKPNKNFVVSCSSLVDVYGNSLDSLMKKSKFESAPPSDSQFLELVFPGLKRGDTLVIPNQKLLAEHNANLSKTELDKDSTRYFWVLGSDSSEARPEWRDFSSVEFVFPYEKVDTTSSIKFLAQSEVLHRDSSGKDSLSTQFKTLFDGVLRSREDWGGVLFELPTAAKFNQGKLISLGKNTEIPLDFSQKNSLKIDSLVPGLYKLELFQDENGNGVWDPGSYDPWRVQEFYQVLDDTIRVQARESALVSLQKMK